MNPLTLITDGVGGILGYAGDAVTNAGNAVSSGIGSVFNRAPVAADTVPQAGQQPWFDGPQRPWYGSPQLAHSMATGFNTGYNANGGGPGYLPGIASAVANASGQMIGQPGQAIATPANVAPAATGLPAGFTSPSPPDIAIAQPAVTEGSAESAPGLVVDTLNDPSNINRGEIDPETGFPADDVIKQKVKEAIEEVLGENSAAKNLSQTDAVSPSIREIIDAGSGPSGGIDPSTLATLGIGTGVLGGAHLAAKGGLPPWMTGAVTPPTTTTFALPPAGRGGIGASLVKPSRVLPYGHSKDLSYHTLHSNLHPQRHHLSPLPAPTPAPAPRFSHIDPNRVATGAHPGTRTPVPSATPAPAPTPKPQGGGKVGQNIARAAQSRAAQNVAPKGGVWGAVQNVAGKGGGHLARTLPLFAGGAGLVASIGLGPDLMADSSITGQSRQSFSNMQQQVAAMLAEGQPLTDEQIGKIVRKHLEDDPLLGTEGERYVESLGQGQPDGIAGIAPVNPDIYGVIAEIRGMAGQ